MRKIRSSPAKTLGAVRSRKGITIRYRHHANHATKRTTLRPNDRAISKVVLQPEPGFRDPRSVHSCITKSPLGFNLGQGAAGGSVGPGISEFHEPFVSFVAADLSLRIGNPSLQDVAPT